MYRNRIFLLSLLIHFSGFSCAQESYKTIGQAELLVAKKRLIQLGDSILKGSDDSVRIKANNLFLQEFEQLLQYQNTFSYPFDSLETATILTSKDERIRVYSWILPAFDKHAYSYFGFIQTFDKKTRKVRLYPLKEAKYENEEASYLILKPDKWYGALYYRMLENRVKGQTLYTLLGWHGKGWKTTRKVIEVMYLKDGEPVFGKPVFKGEGKPACRMVFEFTSQAVMKLNFDERKKMIVFDNLSPARGAEKGQYEFYGPDFRYNGLKFKNGSWMLYKDIDLRNPKAFDQQDEKKGKGKVFYDGE